jgi:hypothetical protein
MKKLAVGLILATAAANALGAQAFFTGRQEQVQTVTYKWVWRCWYNYNGREFYRLVESSSCPQYVEVE